ncbi:octopamine receptor 2-like [Mercenaria mercenaria]|uniref:octopamine receptor 2-like n=1 Tax=Mercenaria mercenaria TaxID=6596 RepID=UPI001E1DE2CA|nr:octopamine receptor 2-like [Mercenaria mercenaria]XP_045188930.1 octopamine receptor 2-like [Mercenaria mercenaria]
MVVTMGSSTMNSLIALTGTGQTSEYATENAINETLPPHVCGSNSSVWLLTSPVCSIKYHSIVTFLVVALILCVITFITIFGNLLVLVALYRFKKLRSMSNCLIGNLAVSDLLLALSVLPISTTYDVLGYWVFGEIMCTIWLCIDVLYCTASIWGLCTIAVDRYTATVYPVWYLEKKSPTRALVYIIFVWMFSIIVSVAPFIGWREMIQGFYQYDSEINRQHCVLFMSKTYVVYSAMGSFVIPTVLMVFLYVRIFIVLRKRTRSMQPMRKRAFYPSESDFESDAHGLDEADSDDRTEVELKAASTQTAPLNSNGSSKAENGTKPKSSMNGNAVNFADTNSHDVQNNQINSDLYTNEEREKSVSRPNLKIEVTDFTENDISNTSQTKSSNLSKNNIAMKKKNCNLKVNYENQQNGKSPSHVSRKSFNEESSEQECETRYLRSPRSSKATFFPWKRGNSGSLSVKHKYELRERRATKRMAMIMACFCFCWWPFLFMYTIRSFCENCPLDMHFQAAIIWLGYANSSLNPILYTIFNDDFRKAFHKIVFCKNTSHNRRHR